MGEVARPWARRRGLARAREFRKCGGKIGVRTSGTPVPTTRFRRCGRENWVAATPASPHGRGGSPLGETERACACPRISEVWGKNRVADRRGRRSLQRVFGGAGGEIGLRQPLASPHGRGGSPLGETERACACPRISEVRRGKSGCGPSGAGPYSDRRRAFKIVGRASSRRIAVRM